MKLRLILPQLILPNSSIFVPFFIYFSLQKLLTFFLFLIMDFKKNFTIVYFEIVFKPTTICNSINDFIMFIESKFHALYAQLLKSRRRNKKNMVVSYFWKAVY